MNHALSIDNYRRISPFERSTEWINDTIRYNERKKVIDTPLRTYSDLTKVKPTYTRNKLSDFIVAFYARVIVEIEINN